MEQNLAFILKLIGIPLASIEFVLGMLRTDEMTFFESLKFLVISMLTL